MRKPKHRISRGYSKYRRRMAIALNRLGLTTEQKRREMRRLTECCRERRQYSLPPKAQKPARIQITTEEYRRLRVMFASHCTLCQHHPSPAVLLRSPDGPVFVVICDNCGNKMRPYQRTNFYSF